MIMTIALIYFYALPINFQRFFVNAYNLKFLLKGLYKTKESPRVGIEPRSQNSKSKSLSIAPQSSLQLLGINSVPISNINTLLQTVTRIFKSRDWYY